jgi:hypothetical protein
MAVLVGVLAPQYIKYLDKSKVGADKQLADNLKQAITTTILDPTITDGLNASSTVVGKTAMADPGSVKFWKEVYGIMGCTNYTDLKSKIKLQTGATISYSVTATKQVAVYVDYTGTNTTYNFTIE